MSWMACCLSALAACGSIETTVPVGEGAEPQDLFDGPTGVELAALGFGEDPYAIGAYWYDYDLATHALSPRSEVYVVRQASQATLFELVSYYDERGTSGFFTLRALSVTELGVGAVETMSLSANVKEEPVCLALSPLAEVSCEGTDAALVFQTSLRALPSAGFAVFNPAIYEATHFSEPVSERLTIATVAAESVEDAPQDFAALQALPANPSASVDPRHARVGWVHDAGDSAPRRDIHMQATTNMQVVQWQLDALSLGDTTVTMDFNVICAPLAASPDAQVPFEAAEVAQRSVSMPIDGGPYSAALVQLCDAETDLPTVALVASLEEAPRGLWADNRTYDLIVEFHEGRLSLRQPPGHLVWNWTQSEEGGHQDFSPQSLPESLWE